MPVGARVGRADIMEFIIPLGNVYQAGTYQETLLRWLQV